MAMKEIKSINVDPRYEESNVNLWQSFGWELKSTQEVKTQDVQTYAGQSSDRTTNYHETKKGEHYVKLTFERDPARQNYDELKSLEAQYYSVKDPDYPTTEPVPSFGGFWVFLAVIGILLFVMPGVLVITLRSASLSKKKKLYDEAYDEAHAAYDKASYAAYQKRQEFMEQARALV
jgi:hypothetical protein